MQLCYSCQRGILYFANISMKRKLFAKPFSQFIKSKSWKNRTILKNLRQCLFKGCFLVYLKWVGADGADAADAGALPDAPHPGVQLLGGEHQLDLRGSCRLLKETFVENLNIYVVSTKIQNHIYTFKLKPTHNRSGRIQLNSVKIRFYFCPLPYFGSIRDLHPTL